MVSLEDSFRLAIRKGEEGDSDFRVTLEAIEDSTKWIQLSSDMINAAYPLTAPPSEAIAAVAISMPQYVEVLDWKGGQFVTFGYRTKTIADLVRFVQEYLNRVLKIPILDVDTALRLVDEGT